MADALHQSPCLVLWHITTHHPRCSFSSVIRVTNAACCSRAEGGAATPPDKEHNFRNNVFLSPTRALRARRGAPRPRGWAGGPVICYLAKSKEKTHEQSMANHTTPPFQVVAGLPPEKHMLSPIGSGGPPS